METRFEKKMGLKEMVMYLISKWIWIIGGAVLVGVIAGVLMWGKAKAVQVESSKQQEAAKQQEEEKKTELIGGDYVYSTLISVISQSPKGNAVQTQPGTYLGVFISNTVITQMIDEFGLQENYIDIFNKMTWGMNGDLIKLTISSPLPDIEGHSGEEILSSIVEFGSEAIRNEYAIADISVIDKPYMENRIIDAKRQTADIEPVPIVISKKAVVMVMAVAIVLICAGLLIKYLLMNKISESEEIERNLKIPVLAEMHSAGFQKK